MPQSRSRTLKRWLLVTALSAGAGGCDIGPPTRTRASEALLSLSEVGGPRGARRSTATPTSSPTGACAEIEGIIAQLKVIGAGRLRFSGAGHLDLDEQAWRRLPIAQRDMLLRTLAAQNRCATGAVKGVGIIRSVQGARVIGRYREP